MVNNCCVSIVQFWTKQFFFFSPNKTHRKQAFKIELLVRNHHDSFPGLFRFFILILTGLLLTPSSSPRKLIQHLALFLQFCPLSSISFSKPKSVCVNQTDCPFPAPRPLAFLFLFKRGKEISLKEKLCWFLSSLLIFFPYKTYVHLHVQSHIRRKTLLHFFNREKIGRFLVSCARTKIVWTLQPFICPQL